MANIYVQCVSHIMSPTVGRTQHMGDSYLALASSWDRILRLRHPKSYVKFSLPIVVDGADGAAHSSEGTPPPAPPPPPPRGVDGPSPCRCILRFKNPPK